MVNSNEWATGRCSSASPVELCAISSRAAHPTRSCADRDLCGHQPDGTWSPLPQGRNSYGRRQRLRASGGPLRFHGGPWRLGRGVLGRCPASLITERGTSVRFCDAACACGSQGQGKIRQKTLSCLTNRNHCCFQRHDSRFQPEGGKSAPKNGPT